MSTCDRNPSNRSELSIKSITHYVKRLYVIFWHELSLDESVRKSPYDAPPKNETKMPPLRKAYYRYVRISFLILHISSLVVLYSSVRGAIKIRTLLTAAFLLALAAIGIICGAHRLWSHNCYKATWPLRLFLMICQTLSSQFSIYDWTKIHRVHHKFSDTPLDPHDSNRGFFFAHAGWFLIQATPETKKELKNVWMEDLKQDRIVMFQHRYYVPLVFLICFIIPGFIPWYFWDENLLLSHLTVSHFRTVLMMHMTFTVNSVAHRWGMKPFDKFIKPVDNRMVWFSTLGSEGWHNYHHVFPWDYKPSEFWGYSGGLGSFFIDLCAGMGLAYNLKTTPTEIAIRRRQKTGDLSCKVWGWNDAAVDPADRKLTKICHKKYEEENRMPEN